MADPQIAIKTENLEKKMGPNQALSGVNLTFEPSLLHGLIGPEGSGKTTLLRLMVGLLRPDRGLVTYLDNGNPVAFARVRSQMAYMPQTQSLYGDLSISEHLDFFRDLYQIPAPLYRERRAELMNITQLDKFKDRPAGQLSGGMYKKLGLMCALLQSPNAMLLDEPTTGVDPISRREFWELLYRMRDKGILIVITTAYMDEAERCDRVHLMEKGSLLATGEPAAVLRQEGVKSFEELFLKRTPRGDAGTPRGDAGTPRGDAGTPRGDAGTPRGDAGTPRGDAGEGVTA